jgi:hypothetical protein
MELYSKCSMSDERKCVRRLKNGKECGIMNAKAFIIFDLNALADTQIGPLYHNASLIWYNGL